MLRRLPFFRVFRCDGCDDPEMKEATELVGVGNRELFDDGERVRKFRSDGRARDGREGEGGGWDSGTSLSRLSSMDRSLGFDSGTMSEFGEFCELGAVAIGPKYVVAGWMMMGGAGQDGRVRMHLPGRWSSGTRLVRALTNRHSSSRLSGI